MDHMQHAVEVSGTFWGHALPGSLFLLWAFYWLGLAVRDSGAVRTVGTLEPGLAFPVIKIVLAFAGVVIEIPGEGWYPHDVMMNWQHVTMYSIFGLSGVVDVLARRGLLAPESTRVAYAAAMGNAGFLFWGHSMHGGVEGLIHTIVALIFFAVAVVAIIETVRPSAGLVWGRIGAQLMLGSWFIVGAWIIYRSGWDLADPVREGWTYTAFSCTAAVASVAALAVRLLSGPRAEATPR